MLVYCSNCSAKVNLVEEAHTSRFIEGPDESLRYDLGRCPSCEGVILAESWHSPYGDITPTYNVVYPAPAFPLPAKTPELVKRYFNEAYQCLDAKAYDAAAVMCRKALDAVCVE